MVEDGPSAVLTRQYFGPTVGWKNTDLAEADNVLNFGADPTGVLDSAQAFRDALGSDRIIYAPPGIYRFITSVSNWDNRGDLGMSIVGLHDFLITGYGATIIMDTSGDFANGYAIMDFYQCYNFKVEGFNIQHGAVLSGFSGGMGVTSCRNFHITDIKHDALMKNQAFFMGYCVHGLINNISIVSGQGLDATLLRDVKFDKWSALGDYNNTGLVFGIAQDPYTSGEGTFPLYPFALPVNNTGVPIPESSGVTFSNNDISGFGAGIWLREGKNYTIVNNNFEDMNPNGSPVCIHLSYRAPEVLFPDGGIYTSEGRPIQNVLIDSNQFTNFGNVIPGSAIRIDAANIVNADLFADIVISNNIFDDGNFCAVNMITGSAAHSEKFVYGAGNVIRGAGFTLALTPEFVALTKATFGTPVFTVETIESNVDNSSVITDTLTTIDATISGNATIAGQLNVTGSTATQATVDASAQVGFSIANGGNAIFTSGGQGMLVMVVNIGSLAHQLAVASGGFVQSIIFGGGWEVNTTTPAGGNQSLAFDAGFYRIYNNTGGNATYKVIVLKPSG